MPRKKRTSTTEKASTKNDTKSSSAARSKSRPAKLKKEPARSKNTSKTPRSKSTVKRGRPARKSKATIAAQDRSRESSVSSASPEKPKKASKRQISNIEKSASKSKKEQSEKAEKGRSTRTSTKSKTKGRPLSKSKTKSSSKQVKAKHKDREEVQVRSTRKGRKADKKQEEEQKGSSSEEEEAIKPVMNTPKRKKQAKEPKSQIAPATPATERTRTRTRGPVCKKEDIEQKEEKKEKEKGKSKKKEKEKKEIPSRAQAKLFQKKIKKEEKELPRFPTTEASIEGLIVEAIKGLKTKAMEDRIIGYLGKRFSDVDGENIKSVLEKMQIDEKLLLKGISGKQIKCGKRSPDRPEVDSLEGTPKKIKISRNSSPIGRFDAKNVHMELETNKGEEKSVSMEEEKPGEVEIKEEADKKLQESPVLIQEEKEIVLSLAASNSKKALIEYYEMKILKIKGLLTEKKEKKSEPIQTRNPEYDYNQTEGQTIQENSKEQTREQLEEPKREEQEEQTRQQTIRRFETEEQISSEQRKLSFGKELANINEKNQIQTQEEKRKDRYMESEEKIEEDEGRGMVIWEVQENSETEKNLSLESIKEAGQENNIELLMKLLAMPGVVQPETTDEQKIEDSQLQRAEEEKKGEDNREKIEDAIENKDGGQEENSTKTEPKLEEQEQKTEEGAQNAKTKNAEVENRESISKKMRSAVENYLEMLQGRVELNYHADNGVRISEEGYQEKNKDKEKMFEDKIAQDKENKKEEENNVKEESDQEKPQKLSVSKFFS